MSCRPRPSCLWLGAVLLVAMLTACDSPEEKAAKYLARGIELYEAGQDAKAMLEFRNVLRIEPKNAEAFFHVGLIHERADRLRVAYQAFEAAVAERPDYLKAQVKLGTLALIGSELDVAERAADAIARIEAGNPDGLALHAALLLRGGELEQAFSTATEALVRDPGNESAIAVQVGVLLAKQHPDEALARLDEAVERLPESVSLRLLKLAVLEQQGDVEGVVRTFEELVALEPTSSNYRLALAGYHQQQGDLGAAESVLRSAMEQGLDDAQTIATLVRLVRQQNGFEAAVAELQRLIAAAPEDYARQLLLADAYLQNDQADAADPVLQAIVAAAPDSEVGDDARMRLAQLRLEAGDEAAAGDLADAVLERSGGHRVALVVKGALALRAGDVDEGIRKARTALREDPSWPPGLRLLAEGHLAKGERDLAVDALNVVVTVEPSDTRAAAALAQLLSERGDLDAASKVWDMVARGAADPAPALQARAAIAIRQGNWTAAEGEIQRLGESPGQEAVAAVLAGNLRLQQRRFDESREWFLRAESLRPAARDPVIGHVRAYLGEQDISGGLDYLQQRVAAHPEDAVGHQLIGELLAADGEAVEAEAAFREAIRLQPEWLTPYRQLGSMLMREGASERAAEVYQAAIAVEPTNAGLHIQLGAAHLAGDRIDPAIAAFEQALEVDQDNQLAANNWAALVADYHYQDEAKLNRALELMQPFRTSEDPFFLDTLAWLYYRKGDYPVALTFIERAGTRLDSTGPQFHYHRGMVLLRNGDTERASSELEKAVADGIDYPGLDDAKATLDDLQAELAQSERS